MKFPKSLIIGGIKWKIIIDPNGILKELINMKDISGYYSVGDIHYAVKGA